MPNSVTIENVPDYSDFEARLEADLRGRTGAAIFARLGAASTSRYMRNATGEGARRRTDTGPLRIVTGRLSRSLIGAAGNQDSVRRIQPFVNGRSALIFGTEVPIYPEIHEKGWSGTVRPHTRTITQAFGKAITPVTVSVGAHQRRVPARPYLSPALRDTSKFAAGQIGAAAKRALE